MFVSLFFYLFFLLSLQTLMNHLSSFTYYHYYIGCSLTHMYIIFERLYKYQTAVLLHKLLDTQNKFPQFHIFCEYIFIFGFVEHHRPIFAIQHI